MRGVATVASLAVMAAAGAAWGAGADTTRVMGIPIVLRRAVFGAGECDVVVVAGFDVGDGSGDDELAAAIFGTGGIGVFGDGGAEIGGGDFRGLGFVSGEEWYSEEDAQ
jgi:hypothetical protein